MCPLFPGKDWLKAYVGQINSSKAYAECAVNWEGDVTLLFEPEPLLLVPAPIYSWLDLWHGKCRAARYDVPPHEGDQAQFVIRAPYSRWKQVMQRELDPTKGMMQGKLKLKGDLPTIVRYTRASQEMTECTTRIPVEFPDET